MDVKRRNLILTGGLMVVVAIMAGVSMAIGHFAKVHDDQSIGVFDVVVDKHGRRWVEIIFDHPITVAAPGEIISPPPAVAVARSQRAAIRAVRRGLSDRQRLPDAAQHQASHGRGRALPRQ